VFCGHGDTSQCWRIVFAWGIDVSVGERREESALYGKDEIHFELKNAVETLVTHSGSDLERLKFAVSSLRGIQLTDFEHQIDRTCFSAIQIAIKSFDLGDSGSIDEHNIRRQLWQLYDRNSPKRFPAKP
ncbi:hypothetical protein, partial [Pseudomonas mosselii]